MKVVVVTNVEYGWDCIVGVYANEEVAIKTILEDRGEVSDKPLSEVKKIFTDEGYCFFNREVKAK